MREKLLKNKTLVIVAAAIVLAAIGFAAGMMVKTSLADDGKYIDAEQAKTIALENVGVSAAKATFTKAELDKSERPVVYDIEFYTASNEYDFEIDAKNGEVVEKSSEAIAASQPIHHNEHSSTTAAASPTQNTDAAETVPTAAPDSSTASSTEYIGVDKAKSIAFKHAGVSASSATVTKSKLDSDDGVKTYEIEFVAGNHEYEYEINAHTGNIMDYDVERIDHDGDHHDDD